jgi:prepilin-type N-terminal cleavage/methylation domain-containing protein
MVDRAKKQRPPHLRPGLSLIELLISLGIVAMLLTATMVAIDASFKAYASAAESANTHTSTRMTLHRLLTLTRTSTAHGPVREDVPVTETWSDWPVLLDELDRALDEMRNEEAPPVSPTRQGKVLTSHYLRVIGPRGDNVVITYVDATDELWVTTLPQGSSQATAQPLLGGVTRAQFDLHRRLDEDGLFVLERASVTLEVEPDADTTLAIESGNTAPIEVVASTKPRKLR